MNGIDKHILAVGNGAEQIALQLWPGAVIDTTPLKPNKKQAAHLYDAILAYHVLPRLSYLDATRAVREWVACLRPGGELQLYVPSLEWAAEQILAEKPSPALAFHLYGNHTAREFFISGYTMRELRALCERVGIAVTHASAGEYTIGDEPCELHLVVGLKVSGPREPAKGDEH